MMKNLLLIFILAVVSACCPCRHIATSSLDSVRVEVRERIVQVPDTVLVKVPAEYIRETVRDTISCLETSYAASEARINPDGSLSHSLENKAGDHPVEVEAKIVYRDSIVYRDRMNTEIVEIERKLTWWQQTKMRGFWLLLVVVVFIFRKNLATLARRFI